MSVLLRVLSAEDHRNSILVPPDQLQHHRSDIVSGPAKSDPPITRNIAYLRLIAFEGVGGV
jgi:hypothetical protein